MEVAYCTNIHSGADLTTLTALLERTWPSVRQRMLHGRPLALGLWFSAQSAREIVQTQYARQLREWLHSQNLTAPTLNGFPFGDFHQAQVKKDVYQPNWFERARWDYTDDLITIAAELAPADSTASISTLPIAWRSPSPTPDQLAVAARYLRNAAERLRAVKDQVGMTVRLCLEPEPGCFLQQSNDVVRFLEEYLFRGSHEPFLRDHIAVCHDICHSSVMFEAQQDALRQYHAAGITVGKIQVSSAICADFQAQLTSSDRDQLREELRQFAEDRYLHQTTIRTPERIEFHDDLQDALAQYPQPTGEWRVHFHVPIHLAGIGRLQTTQEDIRQLIAAMRNDASYASCLLEVETYAWSVLPGDVRTGTLPQSIATELNWFHDLIAC